MTKPPITFFAIILLIASVITTYFSMYKIYNLSFIVMCVISFGLFFAFTHFKKTANLKFAVMTTFIITALLFGASLIYRRYGIANTGVDAYLYINGTVLSPKIFIALSLIIIISFVLARFKISWLWLLGLAALAFVVYFGFSPLRQTRLLEWYVQDSFMPVSKAFVSALFASLVIGFISVTYRCSRSISDEYGRKLIEGMLIFLALLIIWPYTANIILAVALSVGIIVLICSQHKASYAMPIYQALLTGAIMIAVASSPILLQQAFLERNFIQTKECFCDDRIDNYCMSYKIHDIAKKYQQEYNIDGVAIEIVSGETGKSLFREHFEKNDDIDMILYKLPYNGAFRFIYSAVMVDQSQRFNLDVNNTKNLENLLEDKNFVLGLKKFGFKFYVDELKTKEGRNKIFVGKLERINEFDDLLRAYGVINNGGISLGDPHLVVVSPQTASKMKKQLQDNYQAASGGRVSDDVELGIYSGAMVGEDTTLVGFVNHANKKYIIGMKFYDKNESVDKKVLIKAFDETANAITGSKLK